MHPLLGWIALGGAVVLFSLALSNELLTRKVLSEAGRHSAQAHRYVDQAARNTEAIRAMLMVDAMSVQWREERTKALRLQSLGSDRASTISANPNGINLDSMK